MFTPSQFFLLQAQNYCSGVSFNWKLGSIDFKVDSGHIRYLSLRFIPAAHKNFPDQTLSVSVVNPYFMPNQFYINVINNLSSIQLRFLAKNTRSVEDIVMGIAKGKYNVLSTLAKSTLMSKNNYYKDIWEKQVPKYLNRFFRRAIFHMNKNNTDSGYFSYKING
jgi:hypothetical protein